MKKILFITLLFVCSGMLPCKAQEENSYGVDFCFPEGEANGTVVKFMTSYALEDVGDGELKQYSDIVAKMGESLFRKVYGGLPINGRLKFYAHYLEFDPIFGSQLLVKNCKMIRIPYSDIRSAARETKYTIYQFVRVNTVNGSFRFVVMPDYTGFGSGDDICNDIRRKIGQPTQTSTAGTYPEASQRLLTDDDVSNKSAYSLKIMRNEIYARHGFIFKTPSMKNYFNAQSWYHGTSDNVDGSLTDIERANVALIQRYEQR